jgi:hypothetical protein
MICFQQAAPGWLAAFSGVQEWAPSVTGKTCNEHNANHSLLSKGQFLSPWGNANAKDALFPSLSSSEYLIERSRVGPQQHHYWEKRGGVKTNRWKQSVALRKSVHCIGSDLKEPRDE